MRLVEYWHAASSIYCGRQTHVPLIFKLEYKSLILVKRMSKNSHELSVSLLCLDGIYSMVRIKAVHCCQMANGKIRNSNDFQTLSQDNIGSTPFPVPPSFEGLASGILYPSAPKSQTPDNQRFFARYSIISIMIIYKIIYLVHFFVDTYQVPLWCLVAYRRATKEITNKLILGTRYIPYIELYTRYPETPELTLSLVWLRMTTTVQTGYYHGGP